MLVKHWMKHPAVTIDEKETMDRAIRLLKEHDISMLPVLKKDKIVGVLSDRDVKRASASDATSLEIHELLYLISTIRVGEIMTRPAITVSESHTVEETAQILLEYKISGVPVLDDSGKVTGTITAKEIFQVIMNLTGVGKRGIQFALELDDHPGAVKDILERIRSHGGRLVSILSSYDQVAQSHRHVYIRLYDLDRTVLENMKKDLQSLARIRYLVDHRNNQREIFC